MNQRSREEIENQFRSDSPPRKTPQKTDVEQRSVRVIGGEMQGVSHITQEKSFFSLVLIGVIAALILLIVLTAFINGEKNQSITDESVTNTSSQITPTENNIDTTTFVRGDDVTRANNFRKQEQQDNVIESLYLEGLTAFKNGSYTRPKKTSALDYFRQILAIDPENYRAKDGIEKINNRFLEIGVEYLANNNIVKAYQTLENLNSIDKESYHAISLAEEIEFYEINRPIIENLEKAILAEQDGRIIAPEENNALFFFKAAVQLDKDNEDAKAGLQRILEQSSLFANKAINDARPEDARQFIDAIELIDPNHPNIKKFKEYLSFNTIDSLERELNTIPLTNSQNFRDYDNSFERSNTVFDQKTPDEELDESSLRLGLTAYNQRDYSRARQLLTPIADKGIVRAKARLAFIYHLGLATDKNRGLAELYAQEAIQSIQRFANEGRAWAQADLGSMYAYGLAIDQNLSQAVAWRLRSANQQYPEAQRHLGDMHRQGIGVSLNLENARVYYQAAIRNGDIVSRSRLQSIQ